MTSSQSLRMSLPPDKPIFQYGSRKIWARPWSIKGCPVLWATISYAEISDYTVSIILDPATLLDTSEMTSTSLYDSSFGYWSNVA